jgi:hypothetical protein
MKYIFSIILSLCLQKYVSAHQRIFVSVNSNQPTTKHASAGTDITLTGSDLTFIVIHAFWGGLAHYNYQWLPETGLDYTYFLKPLYSRLKNEVKG